MTKHILTSAEMLALNAGQLAYPNPETRAVAIALAWLATPLDFTGRRGRAVVQRLMLLESARELCPGIKPDRLLPILKRLEDDGYLEPGTLPTDGGWPIVIDTTTLPLRCISADDGPIPDMPVKATQTPATPRNGINRYPESCTDTPDTLQGESATNEQEAA